MEEEKKSNFFGIDEEFAKNLESSFDDCECTKYLIKYKINKFDSSYSLSLKTFIALIWNIQNDASENLQIKFSVEKKVSFGRHYVRYTLFLKGTYSEELFIQIPYKIYNYQDGSIFTLLNIYQEINGLNSELAEQQKELVEQSYADFVTNYKH